MLIANAWKLYDRKTLAKVIKPGLLAYCVQCGEQILDGLPDRDMEDFNLTCPHCGRNHWDLWHAILQLTNFPLFVRNGNFSNDDLINCSWENVVGWFLGQLDGHGGGNFPIWATTKDDLLLKNLADNEDSEDFYCGYKTRNGQTLTEEDF